MSESEPRGRRAAKGTPLAELKDDAGAPLVARGLEVEAWIVIGCLAGVGFVGAVALVADLLGWVS